MIRITVSLLAWKKEGIEEFKNDIRRNGDLFKFVLIVTFYRRQRDELFHLASWRRNLERGE